MHVEIDIVASPEEVRAVLLDFTRYHEWHTSFITNIRTIPPNQIGIELVPGNKIQMDVPGTKNLQTIIVCNTPGELRWHGASSTGAFAAQHYFKFREKSVKVRSPPDRGESGARPSRKVTIFGHGEESTGWMCFWASEGWPEPEAMEDMYERFARDLKARVEELKARNKSPDSVVAESISPQPALKDD